jgi:SAM-dependent methyltransferase
MSREVRHPVFARFYTWLAKSDEKSGEAEHRREMLAGLEGRVIEIGAGNGLNFKQYPAAVSEVVAIEPENYLRSRAVGAADEAPVPVQVVDAVADRLPFGDGSFDAGVASLVLCTVPDEAAALAELHRVIRPGGELRFYEHVLANEPRFARFQHRALPIWRFFAGGCHCDRDTGKAIEAAGFEIEECRRFPFRASFIEYPATPHILGIATRAS